MRIAAGIMLIILGMLELIGAIIGLSHFGIHFYSLPINLLRIVLDAFLVAGGVLCLKSSYWGLCLASALLAVFIGIFAVVELLPHGYRFVTWDIWTLTLGAIISTIFIFRTKKEWQKS